MKKDNNLVIYFGMFVLFLFDKTCITVRPCGLSFHALKGLDC